MDHIFIHELKIPATIGLHTWERQIKQTLILDIDMAFDITEAGNTDELSATLDYAAVSERIAEFVTNSEYRLIESVAEQVCQLVLKEFSVERITLTVRKPAAVAGTKEVGVQITRSHSK